MCFVVNSYDDKEIVYICFTCVLLIKLWLGQSYIFSLEQYNCTRIHTAVNYNIHYIYHTKGILRTAIRMSNMTMMTCMVKMIL